MVKGQLQHRGIAYDQTMKIRELKSLLKDDEVSKRKQQYFTTTNTHAREEDVDMLHFQPHHKDAKEWGDAYHF